ncbi:uncharacterized protein METZ01_LOCUS425879, partial [marine metagenome]
ASISSATGLSGDNNHLRVIADHIRAAAFLIMDGISPGNEGRGYVLRRIIRRALRHGYDLGIESPFFYQIVDPLTAEMSKAYPSLEQKNEYIKRIILMEEERFSTTLSQGMKLLEKQINSNPGEILSGEFVFKLYDTYGFPVDLTADIAKVNDLEIDKLGFDQAMDRQKQRSKAGGRFSQSEVKKIDHQLQTDFLGYGQLENSSKVIGIIKDEMTDEIVEGESGQIILEKTSFYAESGGQVGDIGTIQSSNGVFEVTDTQHSGNAHIHLG